jgi:N12 class adenine-specific DNA methylase
MDGSDEAQVVEARLQLNHAYGMFVGRFGSINLRANQHAFDGDPDLPLLLSLEHYNDETKRATKATIFTERTIQHRKPVESANEPKEALLVSLNEHGRVDLDHMAGLLNKPAKEFLPDLKGIIFLNPQSNQWETDDQYLSGNVREKLGAADAAAVTDPRYHENVEALKSIQPEDLPATQIDVRLGASWLPPDDVKQFIHKLPSNAGVVVESYPGIDFTGTFTGTCPLWLLQLVAKVQLEVGGEGRNRPPQASFPGQNTRFHWLHKLTLPLPKPAPSVHRC